ncbi:MAG: hypothetical protein Q4F31_05450 [Eubacteriales bacterium]|nr:hypothetical protein [Eubacteriales bacterium]
MVKLIMGEKGSGKTKILVDRVIEAINKEDGDVVVIERGRELTYNIPYSARLIDASVYDIGSYEFLKGFLCGLHSGNYDIAHIFVENFFKIVNDKSEDSLVAFITWLKSFSENEHIDFVLSLSTDSGSAPEAIKDLIID